VVAAHEFVHRRLAHIVLVEAAQQIVQNAFAHGGFGDIHVLDFKFGEQPRHDGKAAGDHRTAVARQSGQIERVDMPGLDELAAQPGEAVGGDTACRPAALLDDFAQRARASAGAHRLLPVAPGKLPGDALDLDARAHLGGFQRGLVDDTAGKRNAVRN